MQILINLTDYEKKHKWYFYIASKTKVLFLFFLGKPEEEYRRQLGSFGISGELALRSINSLSGGQKGRVAFAVLAMIR